MLASVRFDHRITVANAGFAADPDPIATPGNVPVADVNRVFPLPANNPPTAGASGSEAGTPQANRRLVIGLEAGAGETVTLTVYARNDATENLPAASQRWHIVMPSTTVTVGRLYQTRDQEANEVFVGGGMFYARVTAQTLAGSGAVVFRATP
jgi:hypothetical protein